MHLHHKSLFGSSHVTLNLYVLLQPFQVVTGVFFHKCIILKGLWILIAAVHCWHGTCFNENQTPPDKPKVVSSASRPPLSGNPNKPDHAWSGFFHAPCAPKVGVLNLIAQKIQPRMLPERRTIKGIVAEFCLLKRSRVQQGCLRRVPW